MNEKDFIEKEKLVKEGKLIKIEVKDLMQELKEVFSEKFLKKKGIKVGTKAFHDKYSMIIETRSEKGYLLKIQTDIIFENISKEDIKGKETVLGEKISSNDNNMNNYIDDKIPIENENFKSKNVVHNKFMDSTGWKIHQLLKMIEYYKFFFDQNYLELLKKIYEYKENLSYLFAQKIDGTRNLDDFKLQLAKHLHNYLMSLFSLKDKTMALKNHVNKKFNKKLSEKEYTDKLEEFKVKEYSHFLIDLRHDFTHGTEKDGLSDLIFSYELINGKGDIYIGNESIADIIKSYNRSINSFYNWFFNKIISIFSIEMNETNKLIRDSNKTLGFEIEPGKGMKALKEYTCCHCKTAFKTSKPLGYLNEKDEFLGYVCEKCKNKIVENQIQKIKCSKCKYPLKDVKIDGIPSVNDNDIGIYLFYKCPSCEYEGYIFLKSGKKEFNFIKPEIK